MNRFEAVQAWEIVHYIGMLIYHASHPSHDMKLHWRQKPSCVGLEAPGTFGRIMNRDRFMEISRFECQHTAILQQFYVDLFTSRTTTMNVQRWIARGRYVVSQIHCRKHSPICTLCENGLALTKLFSLAVDLYTHFSCTSR